jgi:hypothetical protein
VLRGWAGPALLDSYEAERRPVGTRNAARSAEPGERDLAESIALDLGGRIAHAWLEGGVSTLDLLGLGLTLLAGPDAGAWQAAAATVRAGVPLRVRALDGPAADAVGTGRDGAVLVRPDGHAAERWTSAPGDPGAALRAAVGRRTEQVLEEAAASA